MSNFKKEKLYINGIPVYRQETEEGITYILFEDNDLYSTVMNIGKNNNPLKEYEIILRNIANHIGVDTNFKSGITVTDSNFFKYINNE
jgi:hypothetical protein